MSDGTSTFLTLLFVVGLGGLAIWYLMKPSTPPLAQQLPPSACGKGGVGDVVGAVGSASATAASKGKTKISSDQVCMVLNAIADNVARPIANSIVNTSVGRAFSNTALAPIRALTDQGDTSALTTRTCATLRSRCPNPTGLTFGQSVADCYELRRRIKLGECL